MRKLRPDKSGDVLGIPLELMVIVLVMAIAIPMVWGFAGMYIREQTDTNLRGELAQLRYAIEKVAASEVGNVRTIRLEFSSHPMARIDYVEIGGDALYQFQQIRYSLGGRGQNTYNLGDLFVSNFSHEGFRTLDISGPGTTLFVKRGGHTYMDTEVIEIGIVGDVYVP